MARRVTGVGGVFVKAQNPEGLRAWYSEHLGLSTNEYGSTFEFRLVDNPRKKGSLQWSLFPTTTKYFAPSTKEFMINFRVEDLEGLLAALRKEGVTIVGEMETYDYGKFAHIVDPEGTKIELWEPADEDVADEDGEK